MARLFQSRLLVGDGGESPFLLPMHYVFLRCHFRGVKLPSNTDKIILEKEYFISANQQFSGASTCEMWILMWKNILQLPEDSEYWRANLLLILTDILPAVSCEQF